MKMSHGMWVLQFASHNAQLCCLPNVASAAQLGKAENIAGLNGVIVHDLGLHA